MKKNALRVWWVLAIVGCTSEDNLRSKVPLPVSSSSSSSSSSSASSGGQGGEPNVGGESGSVGGTAGSGGTGGEVVNPPADCSEIEQSVCEWLCETETSLECATLEEMVETCDWVYNEYAPPACHPQLEAMVSCVALNQGADTALELCFFPSECVDESDALTVCVETQP